MIRTISMVLMHQFCRNPSSVSDARGERVAETIDGVTLVAAKNNLIQLAQLDWYYGWYFYYDDIDYFYWYDAEDVYWEEDYWEDDWLYW